MSLGPYEDFLRAAIEQALRDSRLTQTEVARRIGLPVTTVHRQIVGPSALSLDRAAEILGACGYSLVVEVLDAKGAVQDRYEG